VAVLITKGLDLFDCGFVGFWLEIDDLIELAADGRKPFQIDAATRTPGREAWRA
jgi:hypothetical protein